MRDIRYCSATDDARKTVSPLSHIEFEACATRRRGESRQLEGRRRVQVTVIERAAPALAVCRFDLHLHVPFHLHSSSSSGHDSKSTTSNNDNSDNNDNARGSRRRGGSSSSSSSSSSRSSSSSSRSSSSSSSSSSNESGVLRALSNGRIQKRLLQLTGGQP